MFVVVAYDVVEDGRRAKVSKVMRGYGERVQRSVFECDISDGAFERMRARLARLVDANTDSVRFYRIGQRDLARIDIIGQGTVSLDEEVIVI